MGKKRKPAKGTVKKQQPDYASRTDVDTAEVIRDILEQETVTIPPPPPPPPLLSGGSTLGGHAGIYHAVAATAFHRGHAGIHHAVAATAFHMQCRSTSASFARLLQCEGWSTVICVRVYGRCYSASMLHGMPAANMTRRRMAIMATSRPSMTMSPDRCTASQQVVHQLIPTTFAWLLALCTLRGCMQFMCASVHAVSAAVLAV